MSTYCPAKGEIRDGLCDCGRPATTEVQSGWHNGGDGEPSGGQYTEICEACFAADFQYSEDGQCHLR